jgi:hypothetical protein
VSDFAAPNSGGLDDKPPPSDPHVVSTTYDFSWSAGDTLTALDNATTVCFTDMIRADFPANVSNGFTESQGNNPSCEPVLGKACVDAVLANSGKVIDDGGCSAPPLGWWSLKECYDTLRYSEMAGNRHNGMATFPFPVVNPVLNGTSNSTQRTRPSWTSGGMVYNRLSEPYPSTNNSEYLGAMNQLHILLMVTRVPGQPGHGNIDLSQLLCMRVNASKLTTNADRNNDGFTSTSEAASAAPASSGGARFDFDVVAVLIWTVALASLLGLLDS